MTPPTDQGGASAPPSGSAEAGARFIMPRVASPELVDRNAILIGGVELAAGVKIGAGSCLQAWDAPAISVGANTTVGRHSSVHELIFTSTHIGANGLIGDRVVLHGPLYIGDNVSVGDRTVLFGPTIADGVKIVVEQRSRVSPSPQAMIVAKGAVAVRDVSLRATLRLVGRGGVLPTHTGRGGVKPGWRVTTPRARRAAPDVARDEAPKP